MSTERDDVVGSVEYTSCFNEEIWIEFTRDGNSFHLEHFKDYRVRFFEWGIANSEKEFLDYLFREHKPHTFDDKLWKTIHEIESKRITNKRGNR